MITLAEREVFAVGATCEIPLPLASPIVDGHIDAWLSATPGGAPAADNLARTVRAVGTVLPALSVFTRDVRARWPTGGRAYLVVAYAQTVLATGAVRVIKTTALLTTA